VVGYTVYGDYAQPSPPARIVEAVARGDVDVAVVWGPLAGYFARAQPVPLDSTPVSPQIDPPFLPFVFDISMGVRRGDTALRTDQSSTTSSRGARRDRRDPRAYGVPRVEAARRD
jgi:mxaJ protein